jgi:hypothetical protein
MRSQLVLPLDADKIMLPNPSGDVAEDAGVRVDLRKPGYSSVFTERHHGPGSRPMSNSRFSALSILHFNNFM